MIEQRFLEEVFEMPIRWLVAVNFKKTRDDLMNMALKYMEKENLGKGEQEIFRLWAIKTIISASMDLINETKAQIEKVQSE